MPKPPPVLARVYRGPRVESAHRGSVAVVDDARLAASPRAATPSAPVYSRSDRQAVSGDPAAARREARRRSGSATRRSPSCARRTAVSRVTSPSPGRCSRREASASADLECGAHAADARGRRRATLDPPVGGADAAPQQLLGQARGDAARLPRFSDSRPPGYSEPAHPLQRRIRTLLACYADVPESAITAAVDGCNLPVFRLPLSALARGVRAAASRPRCRAKTAAAAAAAPGSCGRCCAVPRWWPAPAASRRTSSTPGAAAGSARRAPRASTRSGLAAARAAARRVGLAFKIEDGSARGRATP